MPRRAKSARSHSMQQTLAQRPRRLYFIRFVQAVSRLTCSSWQRLSFLNTQSTSRALLPISRGPKKSLHFRALLTLRLDFLRDRQARFLPAIQILIRYSEQLHRRHFLSTWVTPLPPCAPTLPQSQRKQVAAKLMPLHQQATLSQPPFPQVPPSWLTTSQ